ncbi:MAG TPA: hypothetical protein VIK55_04400 [Paludibacter sp.]
MVAAILLIMMVVISISGCAPKNKTASKPQNADQYTFNGFSDELQKQINANISDPRQKITFKGSEKGFYTRSTAIFPGEFLDVYDGDSADGYGNVYGLSVIMFNNSKGKVWHITLLQVTYDADNGSKTGPFATVQYAIARALDKKIITDNDAVAVINQLIAKDTLASGALLKTTKNGITYTMQYTMQYIANAFRCRADIYKSGV